MQVHVCVPIGVIVTVCNVLVISVIDLPTFTVSDSGLRHTQEGSSFLYPSWSKLSSCSLLIPFIKLS